MKDVDSALSQIASIRAQLAATTRFQGIAPELNLFTAVVVFCVALTQSLRPDLLLLDGRSFIALWAGVLIGISCLSVAEACSRARRLHGGMAYTMLSTALQKVLPFYAAGVVITWVVCAFALPSIWLLPGLWLMLIGLLGFSAASNLPRAIVWAAVWYFVCGALVLGFAARSGVLSPWMLGIPVTIGHVLVAGILQSTSKNNRSSECVL